MFRSSLHKLFVGGFMSYCVYLGVVASNIVFYYLSLRSYFRVVFSVTVSGVRFYPQLLVGGSYLICGVQWNPMTIWATWWVSYKEQVLLNLCKHMGSPPPFALLLLFFPVRVAHVFSFLWFCSLFSSCVLCAWCCQCILIVPYWFPIRIPLTCIVQGYSILIAFILKTST